ncbi:glutathione S-transferase family protein [Xanthomonas translucens]|uniref:glutathione S-transferase family protein n=1 Tax=Xanthomonas campestris pv. translucens TaxID=343 RepID=UPI000641E2DA|nr:glutathione S-transferase family protein [Xanthomonas translucens]AKK66079.1 glutathione S-transferase [Xanthomonas translucens pv. undulosa]MCT8270321.1 glutathione S-transferase [Xanthomonas translucens pv. undulosa]WNJ29465.1 glutathione S-transferase [Xanthomonas translucens pv. undulosa]
MDWQATELNNAWRYAFMALVGDSPAHRDALAQSVAGWHRHVGILDAQLQRTGAGAYAAGADCTLADIVLGLSTQRWMATPMVRPPLPAVAAYYERLSARPGFLQHGRNGIP